MAAQTRVDPSGTDPRRVAEAALARLGFSKIPPLVPGSAAAPEFWVRESGVPRRAFPVFLESAPESGGIPRPIRWMNDPAGRARAPPRAIAVVPTDAAARTVWERSQGVGAGPVDIELAILVLPPSGGETGAHWHRGRLDPIPLLRLATGVVIGLFRQAQAAEGSTQVDFTEMLDILKNRFQVDVAGSLGVRSDEESLYLLYQLALRHAYAPGDSGSELYAIALRPFGPGPRVPWFAA